MVSVSYTILLIKSWVGNVSNILICIYGGMGHIIQPACANAYCSYDHITIIAAAAVLCLPTSFCAW